MSTTTTIVLASIAVAAWVAPAVALACCMYRAGEPEVDHEAARHEAIARADAAREQPAWHPSMGTPAEAVEQLLAELGLDLYPWQRPWVQRFMPETEDAIEAAMRAVE